MLTRRAHALIFLAAWALILIACIWWLSPVAPSTERSNPYHIRRNVAEWEMWTFVLTPIVLLLPVIFWRGKRLLYVASLSALITCLLAAMWVRSYTAAEMRMFSSGPSETFFGNFGYNTYVGKFQLWMHLYDFPAGQRPEFLRRALSGETEPSLMTEVEMLNPGVFVNRLDSLASFEFEHKQEFAMWKIGGLRTNNWLVRAPFWLLFACFALTPAAGCIRALLRRPPTPGTCTTCGYDMRGHQAGEKCPECGTEKAIKTQP